MRSAVPVLFCVALASVTTAGCTSDDVDPVVRRVPRVLGSIPHDTSAFTQGLEMHDGLLLEGTGRYGLSDRRTVDPDDGSVVAKLPLPPSQFGEGLTVAGDRGFHLTWREGIVHVFDPASLETTGMFTYAGEGWGICWDGEHLVMSDGSSTLVRRDPVDFSVVSRIEVDLEGRPVNLLNELECTPDRIWANVWQTATIVGIDPRTGHVRDVVDVSSLVPPDLGPDAVLNGIARDPGDGSFWLTGKLWPTMWRVRLD
jgi:glutaminyl-peptide cyclotransferase